MDAGTIKGYSGGRYKSVADKYADDYYAKRNESTGRITWHKIKDKETILLKAQITRGKQHHVVSQELSKLQAQEVSLVKKCTFVSEETAVIRTVLKEQALKEKLNKLKAKQRASDQQKDEALAKEKKALAAAMTKAKRNEFHATDSQREMLRQLPPVIFVVDTNMWLETANPSMDIASIVPRLICVVRGHRGGAGIVIPREVHYELDQLKNAPRELGLAARKASRLIERQRKYDETCALYDENTVTLWGQVCIVLLAKFYCCLGSRRLSDLTDILYRLACGRRTGNCTWTMASTKSRTNCARMMQF